MKNKLTEHDAAEIEKFRLYLVATVRWDNAHDDLPDFAPITDLERMEHMKKRIKAHAAIYEQIYGEKP